MRKKVLSDNKKMKEILKRLEIEKSFFSRPAETVTSVTTQPDSYKIVRMFCSEKMKESDPEKVESSVQCAVCYMKFSSREYLKTHQRKSRPLPTEMISENTEKTKNVSSSSSITESVTASSSVSKITKQPHTDSTGD